MKPDIGMYCYDKCNRKIGIGKIDEFRKNNNVVVQYKNFLGLVSIGNVVSSDDICDLLQVGDYVNGEKVTPIMLQMYKEQGVFGIPDEYNVFIKEIHIKTILTKEQYESNCFRIGD